MIRHVKFALLITVACASVSDVGTQTNAVHGTAALATDPASNAVGLLSIGLGGCSASFVLEDSFGTGTVTGGLGLTAAHCFADLAFHCKTESEELSAGVFFSISTSGSMLFSGADATDTYNVDRIITDPDAFKNREVCASGTTLACDQKVELEKLVDEGHDLAIFHFHTPPGGNHHPPSFYGIAPLRVLTSIDGTIGGSFGTQLSLNQTVDFAATSSTQGIIVGWGDDDDPSKTSQARHAGPVALDLTSAENWLGPNWDDVCFPALTGADCSNSLNQNITCGGLLGWTLEKQVDVERVGASTPTSCANCTGVADGAGDSGSPLLVEGGMNVGNLADLPLGKFIFAVASTVSPQIDDGHQLLSSTAEDMRYAPTYATGNGKWIEDTVASLETDVDSDGVANATDNCPLIRNQDQANCNADFEQANAQIVLGDACDPVPCPATSATQHLLANGSCTFTQTCTKFITTACPSNCALNVDCATCQCCGQRMTDWFETTTLESNAIAAPQGTTVHGLPEVVDDTRMRYCQQSTSPVVDCGPSTLNDIQLQTDTALATQPSIDAAHPWHQTTVVGISGVTTPKSGTLDLSLGSRQYGTYDFTVNWAFQADLNRWLSDLSHPGIPGCVLPGPVAATSLCLAGLWWVSGATTVGTASNTFGGWAHPPSNLGSGINIADNLSNVSAASTKWCPIPNPIIPPTSGSAGWGPGKFVWLPHGTVSLLDAGSGFGDARFVVAATNVSLAGVLQADGTAISLENVNTADGTNDCGGTHIDSLTRQVLFSNDAWFGAVEPSTAINGLPYDALALRNDGTQVLAAAITVGDTIQASPGTKPPGDPPSPRAAYATAYSRVAGGIFVAGGIAQNGGNTLHDVWFGTPVGTWLEVTPHGRSPDLDVIRALTYSFDDRKLWVVDEMRGAHNKTVVRLSRATPSGGIETLATWTKTGLVENYFLSVDHDGAVLVSFAKASGQGFATAKVEIDSTARAVATALWSSNDTLHGPAIVSPVGYSFFVQHGQTDKLTRLQRLPALSTPRAIDESLL